MAIKMADIVARVTSQTQFSSLLAGDQFGFKSAKQYGAVGDGVTDDSAAILSLISAVSASTAKALYFPTGVYKVDNVTLTSTHFSGYYLFGDNASFIGITKDIDQVGQTVGKLSDLNTADKDSIVDAINEVKSESVAALMTTRGDIISRDSTGTIRVGVGTPLQYLVAGNTSDVTPIKYINSPQSVMTAKGDMVYNTTNDLGRIAASTGPGLLAFNISSSAPEFVSGTAFQVPYVNSSTQYIEFAESAKGVLNTKGSMLYANNPNSLGKLSGSTNNGVLIYNYSSSSPQWSIISSSSQGQILQSINGLPSFRNKLTSEVITSTSGVVWSPPVSGMYEIILTGGGGSGAITYSTNQNSGNAGAAGGTAILVTLLSSSESITITIGAGAVVSSSSTPGTAGNNGSASSFGTYATANGGSGGGSAVGLPSAGGTATGGTINIRGGNGSAGLSSNGNSFNAQPGASIFGSAGAYGSGGYAITTAQAQTTQAIARGTNGVCIINY